MSRKYIMELINMSDKALDMELSQVSVRGMKRALVMALLEQDRDTREACSDAYLEGLTRTGLNIRNVAGAVKDVREAGTKGGWFHDS